MRRYVLLRNITVILFVAVCIAFSIHWVMRKRSIDINGPVIEAKSNIIAVSVNEKDINSKILENVTATDKKDGDLTSKVVVEKISKMIDKNEHICNVTFAVCDYDRNVTKKTVKVKFLDYHSPRFYIDEPLVLELGSNMTVKDMLKANDKIEGDITKRVKILSSTMSNSDEKQYVVTARVTNKIGDTSKVKAPVVVRQKNDVAPKIILKEYITYIKKGDKFNPFSYINEVKDSSDKNINKKQVKIAKTSVKTSQPGFYAVEYNVKDKEGREGSVYLTVVVE